MDVWRSESARHWTPALTRIVLLTVVGAGVAVLWLRFNAEPPAAGALFPHDLMYYFYPQMDQVGQRLAAGELPLWNPHPCAGLPLLASLQPAVFYPGTWLSAVLPADLVLSLLALLHLLLAGGSAAFLFRSWGIAPSLAGAFGVVFVFACVLGQTFWPPEVAAIAWLPWMLLCTDRVLGGHRAGGWWLGLVLGTALQLLAGFPQFVVYGLQLLVPYALLRGIQRARRDGNRRAALRAGLRTATALALGAGIAMVQLVPSFEAVSTSDRSGRFSEREVHYLSGEPRLTQLLENAVTPEPRLTTFDLERGAGYLGTGTLVLLLVALVGRRREPLVWCLAAAGVGCVVLSDGYLGVGRELYRLYAMLPGIGYLRAPERLLFPGFACLIALAALGADVCDRTSSRSEWRSRAWLGAAALLGAGAVALAGSSGAAWRAAIALAWVAGTLLLPPQPALRRAWRGLAVPLLVADVAAATGPFASLRDLPRQTAQEIRASGYSMLSAEEFSQLRERAGLSRVEFVGRRLRIRPLMGVGSAGGVYRLACYETLLPGQWPALSRMAGSSDLRSAVMANLSPDRLPALYDIASVSHITRATRRGRGRDARGISIEALENRDALPRAYLVDRYQVIDDDEALTRVVSGDFDYRRMVLLDREPGLSEPGRLAKLVPAEILDYAPERVEVAVQTPSQALLILTDTYYAGWRATVDGSPTAIHRANGLFRAVLVPAGDHLVSFEYTPASLRVGAWVSVFSLLAALATVSVPTRLRRVGP